MLDLMEAAEKAELGREVIKIKDRIESRINQIVNDRQTLTDLLEHAKARPNVYTETDVQQIKDIINGISARVEKEHEYFKDKV
jgi:hypothetical protein